jgi:rRNA processing protein Krr1/Pno1
MIDNNTFRLNARGSEMTLKRSKDGWNMHTVNAAVRAWNRGFAIPKSFSTLAEVEAKYKSWRGIASLATEQLKSD